MVAMGCVLLFLCVRCPGARAPGAAVSWAALAGPPAPPVRFRSMGNLARQVQNIFELLSRVWSPLRPVCQETVPDSKGTTLPGFLAWLAACLELDAPPHERADSPGLSCPSFPVAPGWKRLSEKRLISMRLFPSITSSASTSPMAAECLKPWPEQGEAMMTCGWCGCVS